MKHLKQTKLVHHLRLRMNTLNTGQDYEKECNTIYRLPIVCYLSVSFNIYVSK